MATIAGPLQWFGPTALSSGFRSAGLLRIAGVPAHALVVAVVAVLLPLAALCAIGMAVHRGFRQRFGSATLVLTAVAVAAVPLAQYTGRQLADQLGTTDPLVAHHVELGNQLLPYALGFGVAVVVLLVAGKLADRERAAEGSSAKTWQRISTLLSVLVVAMAVLTTVEVVRIGSTGAQAVWTDKAR
ncbi:MAG TPA: hypothetical protein VHZ97_30400 [Pseudonocardiaceae bacterium]|jgi:hypothetical protein|nr:hypothetical protein [Pseudonocardiaceae bacterium]